MIKQHAANPLHKKPGIMRNRVNYSRYGYYFVAPFVLTFCVFQLYSIFFTFRVSFSNMANWNMNYVFTGINNYLQLLSFSTAAGQSFWSSLGNTVIIWIVNFIPQIGMAMFLAHWFTSSRMRLRFQGAFKVLIFLPNTITAATIAVLFFSLFNYPVAPVNTLLHQLGLMNTPYQFLRDVPISRGLISFIQWWLWYGNTMIILIAGILGINPALFEAGLVDGCSSGQMFRMITLPLLRPILLYNLVTSLIGGLQMFDIPHLFTQGNPNNTTNTVARFIYNQAFTGTYNFNTASAASVILLFIIVILSLLLFWAMRDRSEKRERRAAK